MRDVFFPSGEPHLAVNVTLSSWVAQTRRTGSCRNSVGNGTFAVEPAERLEELLPHRWQASRATRVSS